MNGRLRLLTTLLVSSLLLAGCAGTRAPTATTVVVVRHAEKMADAGRDPELTLEGRSRAEALLEALEGLRIDRILTTQFERNRATARSVAEHTGVAPEVVEARGDTDEHVLAVADAVRSRPGAVVLVVGHSNTVPRIVHALGGPDLPDFDDRAYSDLFVLTLSPNEPTRTIHARYGAPNPE